MPVEVLSYDPGSGELVARPVVNWFDNGPADHFLQFTVAKGGKNGRAQFAATPNHPIMTPGGWRPAEELVVGDRVLQAVPHYLSDFQWEALLGMLMGDGALSPTRSGHGARLRWGHGAKQVEYGDWKASLFANVSISRSVNAKGAVFHDMQPMPELAELRAVRVHRRQEGVERGLPQAVDSAVVGTLVHGRCVVHGSSQGSPGPDG